MWCPPGYLSLEQFDAICWEAGEKLFPRPEGFELEPLADGAISFEHDPSFYAMFAHFWLLARYVERADTKVSLCSPDGVVVDVPGHAFMRRYRKGELTHWDISPTKASYREIADVFLQHKHGWENVDTDGIICAPRYVSFAYLRGSLKAAPSWLRVPAVLARAVKRLASRWWGERADRSLTRRFIGWSVCFRDGTYPSDATRLLEFFHDSLAPESLPESGAVLRHVGKRQQIASILAKEFPDGFDGIPAKVLQGALAPHFVRLPHEDTVRRAIGRKS